MHLTAQARIELEAGPTVYFTECPALYIVHFRAGLNDLNAHLPQDHVQ